jgi:hypothetical protein
VGAPKFIAELITQANMSDTDTGKETGKEIKTGRYIYDKKLGKVVKISDEIVGIKKGSSAENIPSGCPMNPGGHNCGGGCGCHG